MEIKNTSDLPGAQPGITRISDLLTQLRAAGSIEAEVVKLLQDNKLLLSTRLGQILTSNKLHYRPGDRITLRIEDSGQQPVLKVSSPVAKPISLDSRQYPELARQLPPDLPLLARVVKVVAQRAEVQLADQFVKLPRQVIAVRNQILSLRRNAARHSIDITPVEPKVIYKAVLQQLVPRQQGNRDSSLVKLLNLVSRTSVNPDRPPTLQAENKRQPQPFNAALRGGNPTSGKPLATSALGSAVENHAGDRPRAAHGVKPGASGGNPVALQQSFAVAPGRATPSAPPAVASGGTFDQAGTGTPGSQRAHKPGASALLGSPVKSSLAPAARAAVISGAPGVAPAVGAAPVQPVTSNRASTATAASAQNTMLTARDTATIGVAAIDPASPASTPTPHQNISALRGTAPTLQPLLQLVARLPEIDGAQVKRWFELTRLIKQSKSENTPSATLDVFRILKQFAERESLNRELTQVFKPNTKPPADGDTATTRAPAQDPHQLQLREVMKLAEQSLSHNLLQRATLGLQQETQQPFSLSLALPFIDNQAVKPIHIDLAERRQTQSEDDKSWDIRLSFELAGLGSIACHLVLEGRAVAASFYSEQEITRNRIEAELPLLRAQLSSAGFTPGEFHSFPGPPASLQASGAPDFSESLVDIEA